MKNTKYKKPRRGKADIGHTITKAGLSAIPVIGGPAAELLSAIISPPLSKRRDKWIESIAQGLQKLEHRMENFKIENLSQNDMFITTAMHATQAAIRNHQKEKLEALRNAVLNAALPNAPEEDIQLMFLNFVDRLTTWHLRILKFLDNPKTWGEKHAVEFPDWMSVGLSTALEHAMPELRGRREFYDLLANDLYSCGLMSVRILHNTMSVQDLSASSTTNLGKEFLRFITSPVEGD